MQEMGTNTCKNKQTQSQLYHYCCFAECLTKILNISPIHCRFINDLWRCFSKRAFAVAAFTYQMRVKSITYLSVCVISEIGIQPPNLGGI